MRRSINEQFCGSMEVAEWISKEYNKDSIKNLLESGTNIPSHIFLTLADRVQKLDFWVIGPKESEAGLFIYGHLKSGGSTEGKIKSIIPTDEAPMSMYIKTTSGKLFFVQHSRSLHSIVKKVDMFLSGAYTDVPLMSMDELFDIVDEIQGG